MSDYIVTLSHDDHAAFMAAVADLEEGTNTEEAIEQLSRIASIVAGQTDGQYV